MRVGSLFTGYGGLDIAVGGDLAWYAEIEPAACKVLSAHYPSVPNLGDITTINWAEVEPVDILTGGYPCQPFSHAGQRKGKNDERHLWPYVLDAIRGIRPRYAILENVSGHLSLGFDIVLSDLASIGFDAEWGTFRASDVGAPHQRKRLFIVAYPNAQGIQGHENIGGETPSEGRGYFEQSTGSPTTDTEHNGLNGGTLTRSVFDAPADSASAERGGTQRQHLGATAGPASESGERAGTDWGKYAPAIRRWETVLGRPAPTPTTEHKNKRRLNPVFVEWMMGLNEGHVTGHGLSAAQELKMLGNGVVPQQAHAAITQLMQRVQSWAS